MRIVPLVLIAGALSAPAAILAQTYIVQPVRTGPVKGSADVHLSKAALAGHEVRVWASSLLNADCTPAGTMETAIVDQPRHGKVTISDEPFYPNFAEPNPRVVCDARKAPGKQAFYTSDPDFHGHDKIVLQNATSEGRMRRVTIDVMVE